MLCLLPHDDDDLRDDLIFEISLKNGILRRKKVSVSRSSFFSPLFKKSARAETRDDQSAFFFFQKVKQSLLAGERAAKEYTESTEWSKKASSRMKERKKGETKKKENPRQKKMKKMQKILHQKRDKTQVHFPHSDDRERKEDRKKTMMMTTMMQTIHTQRYQSGNSATSSSSKKSTKPSSSFHRGSGGAAAFSKRGFGDEKMIKRRRGRCALMNAAESSSEAATGDFEAALDPVYKNIFYDVPVSNNGARNRLIICWKNIEDEFEFKNPSTLGGLKSPEFLEMHPQGKMPLLVTKDGQAIPESEVISQYLCDAFEKQGPSLRPETLEAKTACNLATRWHDVYLTPIQGCMYRGPMSPEVRAEQISEIDRLLDVMEKTVGGFEPGPYLCGDAPSTADAALFPTFVFMTHLLPKYFGWENVFDGRPSLERWYKHMSTEDACAKKIKMEVMGGLMAWDESDRYEKNGLVAAVANDSFQWSY